MYQCFEVVNLHPKKSRYHKITVQLCPQQTGKSLKKCQGKEMDVVHEEAEWPIAIYTGYNSKNSAKTRVYKKYVIKQTLSLPSNPKQRLSKRSIKHLKANSLHETSHIIITKATQKATLENCHNSRKMY